ncbi:MAG: hypothetical protein HXY39_02275 [Chloroflexi bacterium]|nr:hypothetical protein [Chloroflexota bacterium]
MQAFKRACALFGLGRYLYHLPQVWVEYDDDKRSFVDPAGVIRRIYTLAGLTSDGAVRLNQSIAAAEPMPDGIPATNDSSAPAEPVTPAPARHGAPATRQASAHPATTRQVHRLRNRAMAAIAQERFGVTRLEDLSFAQASALIGELPLRATRATGGGIAHTPYRPPACQWSAGAAHPQLFPPRAVGAGERLARWRLAPRHAVDPRTLAEKS